MKKITHREGDSLILDLLKPIKGRYPIARTPDGIICLIERTPKPVYYEYGSMWTCEVVEVKDRVLIIRPLLLELTAAQNEAMIRDKAIKAFGKEKVPRKKQEKNYQYKAHCELA